MLSSRKFINLLVFIISILTVNLLTDRITEFLLSYKQLTSPAKATLLGMLLTVAVLYPAFTWLDDLSEQFTKKFFKAGKSMGGKSIGIVLAFATAFGVLFMFYLNLWFGLKVWDLF
jgi:hypothetical protein